MRTLLIALLICSAPALPSISSAAGDGIDVINNIARDYIPAPDGTLALFGYYKHIWSNRLYSGGNKVPNSPSLTGDVGIFRPVYFLELGPLIMDPQVLLPFGHFRLDDLPAPTEVVKRWEMGDPIFTATIWFVHDAPSMTWIGFTPFFTVPAGDYNREKGVNAVAGNRWKFQEELGIVKGFSVMPGHPLYLELQLAGIFQTNNDNATNPNTGVKDTKETDPIFKLESHVSYDLTKSLFVSADYYFATGGKDSFNGHDVPDSRLQYHTVGGTLSFNALPNLQLLLQYSHDFGVKNGFESQVVLFRLLYVTDLGATIRRLK